MPASNPGHCEAIRFGKSSSLVMSFNPTAALRTYFSPEAILGATHRQAPATASIPAPLRRGGPDSEPPSVLSVQAQFGSRLDHWPGITKQ